MTRLTGFGVLITCEHASWRTPPEVELGLSEDVLRTHVSYDRGAEAVARALARELAAPLHVGRWSRLVVDLNRKEDNPDVIVPVTYGVRVPGNEGLTGEDRRARLERWHRPYREAARADALALAGAGGCLHLSSHAFDPEVDPPRRDFDAGILFDPDREPETGFALALVEALVARGTSARPNQPYHGTPEGLTSWLREQIPAERYVGIEIESSYRVTTDERGPELAARLVACVRALLG